MNGERYAILIDAENIAYNYVKYIFKEISSRGGVATYKRAYGNFTAPNLKKWESIMLQYAIVPELQYSNTVGKNASDSKLIIDAMDILYTGNVDGFCIVTSDSDFTGLVSRLNEGGKTVIGMGEAKTPVSLINACTKFIYLDVLLKEDESDVPETKTVVKSNGKDTKSANSSITDRKEIEEAIIKILAERDGPVHCGEIGSKLDKLFTDFDQRNYGFSKLTAFLNSIDGIDVIRQGKIYTATLNLQSTDNIRNSVYEILSSVIIINVGELKQRLCQLYNGFDSKAYGYAKFSVFLSNECPKVKIDGNNVYLK